MTRFIITAMLFVFLAASPQSIQAREITNPDEAQIDLLYRYLASDPPDFSVIARKDYKVRSANEFDRANVAKRLEDNLRRDYQLMKDVDVVRMRVRARLSDYDTGKGGFYLSALSPTSFFRFGKVSLAFENADKFHLWVVPIATARTVLEKTGYGRDVILDIRMRPFAIDAARGQRLRTQVISLGVYSKKTNENFANLTIPKNEYRQIKIAGLATGGNLDADKLNVLGLTSAMNIDAALKWAGSNGYWMFSFSDNNYPVKNGSDGVAHFQALANKSDFTPDMYFSSDKRAFELEEVTGGWGGAKNFKDRGFYSIFGKNLDCNAPQNLGVKCGEIRFTDVYGKASKAGKSIYDSSEEKISNSIKSVAILQSAVGATREQIIALLTKKYGPPADNIKATIFRQYQSNLLVWGRSKQQDEDKIFFSNVTQSQNWELEAYIIEPDGNRIVVITHMSVFPKSPKAKTSGGNGAITF